MSKMNETVEWEGETQFQHPRKPHSKSWRENEEEKTIKACANIIIDAVVNVIYADPHGWSKRPCDTCRTISAIIGKPFGCYRYQKEKATGE